MSRAIPRFDRIECSKDKGVIRSYHAETLIWELPISAVHIVAESTDDNGPFIDDYFFCFVTGKQVWHECSFYSEGRPEFLRNLGEQLGVALELDLVSSADFASRILWPPELLGKPLFTYTPVRSRNFLCRLLWIKDMYQELTPEVTAYLNQIIVDQQPA